MIELETVEGIGPKTKELLNKLNIKNGEDLINHYPFRYEVIKRTDMNTIEDGDKIVIDGIIEGQPTIIYINKSLKKIIFRISTKASVLNVTLYNRVYMMQDLKPGKEVTIIGRYHKIKNAIIASEIRFGLLPPTTKIEPIYSLTSGLTSKQVSKYITTILESDYYEVKNFIPKYLEERHKLLSKKDALNNIHIPVDGFSLKKGRQRIKYEELFMYMLKIEYLKNNIEKDQNAISRNISDEKIDKFIKNLPFKLTKDQESVTKEIIEDLRKDKRMNRLLQGDVGCGKTIVAFIAAYANYLSKYQTALMVPTEILARQHYEGAKKIFNKYKLNISLLTSSTTKKEKEEIYKNLEDGSIDLIIGTHSLIQEKVKFKKLGLVITDEQHRFGVNQRENFKNKGVSPDILSMSATPIPRTYALTIYGDMDISSIKTKPEGRKVVKTIFKREKDIEDVLELMKEELDKKHQIYVVSPSIEESENGEDNSVEDLEEKMNNAFGKIAKIGIVHGKIDTKDEIKTIKDFENNKINILVSTTVIEVGVNVPNASMIVIFNANMFGLSTLHQLRGRVGRSDIESTCILISKGNEERLRFLEKNNDGFAISEYDFEARGEGDLFGIRQSGELELKMANIKRDYKMLLIAKEDAKEFISTLLTFKDNPEYKEIYDELDRINNLE